MDIATQTGHSHAVEARSMFADCRRENSSTLNGRDFLMMRSAFHPLPQRRRTSR